MMPVPTTLCSQLAQHKLFHWAFPPHHSCRIAAASLVLVSWAAARRRSLLLAHTAVAGLSLASPHLIGTIILAHKHAAAANLGENLQPACERAASCCGSSLTAAAASVRPATAPNLPCSETLGSIGALQRSCSWCAGGCRTSKRPAEPKVCQNQQRQSPLSGEAMCGALPGHHCLHSRRK